LKIAAAHARRLRSELEAADEFAAINTARRDHHACMDA